MKQGLEGLLGNGAENAEESTFDGGKCDDFNDESVKGSRWLK